MTAVNKEALKYLTPVREFTLHNATDEWVVIMYAGETRNIPPANKVVKPHDRYEDVCHSARDEDGDYIPGTLVLRDSYEHRENSAAFVDGTMHWSAASAIKHCLGIDVSTGEASSAYARKGISVLPEKPSKELVAKVRAEGQARYLDWKVEEARAIISAYEERTLAHQRLGMTSPPPGRDYDKAVGLLKLAQSRDQANLEEVFGKAETTQEAPEALESEDEIAERLAALITQRLGSVGGQPVDRESKEAQAESLLQDPEFMKILKKQYKVRKIREFKKNAPSV